MSISWEWTPNVSLGPIELGERVNVYEESFGVFLEGCIDDDKTGWERYKFPNLSVYIDAEKGVVVSVAAYDEFMYKGKNIIGMGLKEMEELLEFKADEIGDSVIYQDDDVQIPYDYFSLGLQVWLSEGMVVSASCVTYAS